MSPKFTPNTASARPFPLTPLIVIPNQCTLDFSLHSLPSNPLHLLCILVCVSCCCCSHIPIIYCFCLDLGDQCKPSNMYNILYLVFVGLTAATMLAVGVSLCFAGNCLGDGYVQLLFVAANLLLQWKEGKTSKHSYQSGLDGL